jgi:hypothetical protein
MGKTGSKIPGRVDGISGRSAQRNTDRDDDESDQERTEPLAPARALEVRRRRNSPGTEYEDGGAESLAEEIG